MAKVRVDLDLNQRALARLTTDAADSTAQRVANTLAQRVRSNIAAAGRIDTGRMIRSVNITVPAPGRRTVSVDTPYAMFQEEGIGPVYPVRAKVLRFTVGSRVVYTKRTSGFPGAHFMRNAFESLGQADVNT